MFNYICTTLSSQSGEHHLGKTSQEMIFANKNWSNMDSLICKTSLVPCLWKQKKPSNPTTEESQVRARAPLAAKASVSESFSFRFSTFPKVSELIDIMNLIKTRCVKLLWEKNKTRKHQTGSTSKSVFVFSHNLPRAFCAKTKWPAVSSSFPQR